MFCRTWYGWLNGELAGKEMIVPEVSRVTHEPVDGVSVNQSDFLLQLFNHPRLFSESVISFICFDILFLQDTIVIAVSLFCAVSFLSGRTDF